MKCPEPTTPGPRSQGLSSMRDPGNEVASVVAVLHPIAVVSVVAVAAVGWKLL